MNILPTPSEIISQLDSYVQGQVQAKRDLAVAVYNHYLALAYRAEQDGKISDFGKQHVLIIGPSGSGKTYLVQSIARVLGVPVSFASATALTEAGYTGQPVESILRSLILAASYDIERAQRGIVFIDEIDKIRKRDSLQRDVSGEGVQEDLLTMLDGRNFVINFEQKGSYQLDTSNILFICTGAFTGLDDIIRERTEKVEKHIGFSQIFGYSGNKSRVSEYDILRQVQLQDLREYGYIPEFIGRFATVSVVHPLRKEDLIKILVETRGSILTKQQALFRIHGITLTFTPDALDAIAQNALDLGTGARGLARELMRSLDNVDYRLPELADSGVSEIIISGNVVRGISEPEIKTLDGKIGNQTNIAEDLRLKVFSTFNSAIKQPLPMSVGFTDTANMSIDEIKTKLNEVKENSLGWSTTTGSARLWWEAFEKENAGRFHLVLRVAEELQVRKASITEFFMVYIYSNTDNIQANLHYLDYVRLKTQSDEDKKKKEP